LWGANAVNGVINIITKSATKTQGPQVVTSAGADEGYAARLRYGGSAGSDIDYRLYGTSNDWLPTVNAAGVDNYDTWNLSQGGARVDWKASQNDSVTFDGEGYSGRVRDAVDVFSSTALPANTDVMTVLKGGHLLGQWKHAYSERSSSQLLGYCDWNDRVAIIYTDYRTTCDVEWQQNYAITDRQNLTLGAGVTTTRDDWPATFTFSFTQPTNRYTTVSEFVQYDVTVVPDKLRLIGGSKFDYNNYTGFELQPQIRAVWTPNESMTIWGAVSRAVRTPSRIDETLQVHAAQINPVPPPLTFIFLEGQGDAESELLDAYEIGYRWHWHNTFSLDAAAYYNAYDNLASASVPGTPMVNLSPFYIDIPEYAQNLGRAQTHGLELSLGYVPVQRWTISATVSELRGTSTAATAYPAVANNPRQQFNLQSRLDAVRGLHFDSNWYHYNAIPDQLPLVNRADVGVSTNSIHGFTFSLWGRNLQQDRHLETIQYIFLAGEIRRAVVFKMVWEPGEK
jgi:iron complex outermembrane recepter protein